MVSVSFVNGLVTVTVDLQDETIFEFARDILNDEGINVMSFDEKMIEML